ncbi:MAG: antitoxin Xre/MbcA/ParS toxin-binding domain-containing protein [Ignavibacteriaceae bacterium]
MNNLTIALDKKTEMFVKHLKSDDVVFSKKITYSDFLNNKLLIIRAINKGIPFDLFKVIVEQSPFTLKDWADLLSISLKSLQRYEQGKKRFKPLQSEKIIELAEVIKLGLDVFNDMDKFKYWLETENYSLGSIKPINLLKNSYGKEMVIAELTRIEHGIFA